LLKARERPYKTTTGWEWIPISPIIRVTADSATHPNHPKPLHPDLNSNLGTTTKHNQHLHVDLFGPAHNEEAFILCLTDSLTRYTQLISLTGRTLKPQPTPFFSTGSLELHPHTTPRSPFPKMRKPRPRILQQLQYKTPGTHIQVLHSNTVANPIVNKPLATQIDETFINWTPYLYPLMFNYNTSFWLNDLAPHFGSHP
jgi:hypothetical protein